MPADPIAIARAGEGNLGVRQFYVSERAFGATHRPFECVIRAFAVDAAIDRGGAFESPFFETMAQGPVRRSVRRPVRR